MVIGPGGSDSTCKLGIKDLENGWEGALCNPQNHPAADVPPKQPFFCDEDFIRPLNADF